MADSLSRDERIKVYVRIRHDNPSIKKKPTTNKTFGASKDCVTIDGREKAAGHIGRTVKISNTHSYTEESKLFTFDKVCFTYFNLLYKVKLIQ